MLSEGWKCCFGDHRFKKSPGSMPPQLVQVSSTPDVICGGGGVKFSEQRYVRFMLDLC